MSERLRLGGRAASSMMALTMAVLVACGGGSDGGPSCPVTVYEDSVDVERVEKIDLLFVVDGSGSMAEEQAALAAQVPAMAKVLASGDYNDDGEQDFPPVPNLHLGVVTADMGSGGHTVTFADVASGPETTCPNPEFGDDGVLRTVGSGGTGCMAAYPSFLSFRSDGGTDPAALGRDLACVAAVGTTGCGYEQPLEAALKAVTPASADTRFQMDTTGHGDGANADFLRDDSLLAIIIVTDEEDCSVPDPEFFNPTSSVYPVEPSLRCFRFPTVQHPVERYVEGFLDVRDNPNLLVFGAIAGVPPAAVQNPDAVDYAELLADPAMQELVDPDNPQRLVPSCDVAGRGEAFPSRRIVEVAQQLRAQGVSTLVQSICQENWTPILLPILQKLSDTFRGLCIPAELTPPETGLVDCDVTETLPAEGDSTTCASIPGRESIGTDESGREVCRVVQLPVVGMISPSGNGWYYDDFSAQAQASCGMDGQQISYTAGDEPVPGTTLSYECMKSDPLPGDEGVEITIGSSCAVVNRCSSAGGITGALLCDSATNTCQKGCASDEDCAASALDGWRCGPGGFCENPSCE